ncbi:MAG: hypothetical protein FWG47_05240 [Propionibacteriaceae bacterium]|nr:hypothetical protein [Propionibacteriaceae bacterium]
MQSVTPVESDSAHEDDALVRSGFRSVLRVGVPLWVLAGLAVVCLGIGFVVGGVVRSPEDVAAASRPPAAGLITARVEARQISAVVSGRADVEFSDPVVVDPPIPLGVDAAIVTGRVPQVGVEVSAGMVLLEVSGRPVIVLPGKFSAYRSLGAGSVGPDVAQLRKALSGLGYAAGNGGQTYDAALAAAVKQLYKDAGYPAPGSQNLDSQGAVSQAQDGLSDAKDAQSQASKQVTKAKSAVSAAEKSVTAAKKLTGEDAAQTLAAARADLEQAKEALADAQQSLKLAKREVSRAQTALDGVRKAAWTPLPMGEVIFVSDLPRRVDAVNVKVGQDLSASPATNVYGRDEPSGALVLAGAELTVKANVSAAEGQLLQVGGQVALTAHDGSQVTGVITSICDQTTENVPNESFTSCQVGIAVESLTPETRDGLVGNVLATFQVGRSAPDGLVVPVAAVSADSSRQARVEVVVGELVRGQPAAAQPTQIVLVETGLSAQGYVEIVSATPPLHAGDLVVVGQGVAPAGTPTVEATP